MRSKVSYRHSCCIVPYVSKGHINITYKKLETFVATTSCKENVTTPTGHK